MEPVQPGTAESPMNCDQLPQEYTWPTSGPDTTKHTSRYSTAQQRKNIQLHPPEHRQQSPLQGNPHKALVQTHPMGADTTSKRNYDLAEKEIKKKTQ